ALGIGYFYGEFEVGITVLNGCIINGIQYGIIINVEDENTINPPVDFLLNNYPNPFNPQTKIKFYIAERTFVKLKIFDLLGDEVKILVSEEKASGYHEIIFDGSNLPSGVYFYTLQTPKFFQTKKMVLLR
ncbi:MAG: T9SS type A sorting domain-containing protein, partial [Ignavibacteria bacterium]|nr:T9SS type A sorting domain-containing protein [Ignavibacteria bacterium]